jgi:hypothetical protein
MWTWEIGHGHVAGRRGVAAEIAIDPDEETVLQDVPRKKDFAGG